MAVAADEVCGKLEDMESSENSDLSQELQVLKEIYITELSINRDASGHLTSIDVQLHPATGENVSQKWVCLTLQLIPPLDYPNSIPEICIRGPRGLADEHVASMKKHLYQIAEDRKGEPMMYELIESAKESLTQMNIPYGQCMICLDDFGGSHKEFTKTDCYHYFHCGCLSLYVNHCKTELEAQKPNNAFAKTEVNKEIVCPVCRELLPSDLDLSAFQPESGAEMLEERYTPSEEMQGLQRTMADLFEKQKQKGGIIDLDEERNKYLLPKDFVYVGSVEESSQDIPLSESVQAASVLKENDQTSKNTQHQRQRDYGGRGGNKGIREHERGGRGARKNRKECDFERSEFGREREEYGDERGEYGRRRGDHGRERDYAKERSSCARERGYRRPRQEEKQGTWQNKEGSRSNRSNKFYDQGKPGDVCSTASEEAQNKRAGNENASTEKIEKTVETEQSVETENSGHGSTVTQENQVAGDSAKQDQLRKVEEVEPQRTTKNSRQSDSTLHGKEAPSEKSGNFMRRDRRQERDRYDRRVEGEFPRRYLQKSQHRGERHLDFHSKGSDDRERSKCSSEVLNVPEQQSLKEIETLQKEEMANNKKLENATDTDVTSSCQGKSEPVSSGRHNSNRKLSERDNNDRWQRHHRRDQDQKQYREDCSRSNFANKDEMLKNKISDGGRDSLKDRGSVMASTHPEQPKDVADSQLCEIKMLSLNTNDTSILHVPVNKTSAQRQSSKHENHFKPRLHARENAVKTCDTGDHHERCSGTDETSRENLHKDFHSKPKTVTDQKSRDNPGKATITQRNCRNPQRSEAKSHPKEGRQFNDRQKFRKDAKLEIAKDRNDISESRPAQKRNAISESRPAQNRNDISESRPAQNRNDISESRPAQNDRPIYDEPRSSSDATNPKSSHSEKSTEVHPGFHIRSISTVET